MHEERRNTNMPARSKPVRKSERELVTTHTFDAPRELVSPKRLVGTFEYEGMPGHVLVETATFEEIRGKTKLTQTSLFENAEDLEGMLASGMEEGAAETMERFTELVAEMPKRGAPAKAADRELVIVRVFDAPRALVW